MSWQNAAGRRWLPLIRTAEIDRGGSGVSVFVEQMFG
jgi:hypothetical protein